MSLDPRSGRRSISPANSGRSSPALRSSRRLEDDTHKRDKPYRRYAAGIDKALASFDPAQQEWADYIAFLGRLIKAIQTAHAEVDKLPHDAAIALRLSQCLNPALPSGVHQKALEVYSAIFATLSPAALSQDLPIYLPGLVSVLSFASLSVRPLLYRLFDNHILNLGHHGLRPAAKSIILCLLPGIEDETSEDFEEGLRILDKLRKSLLFDAKEGGTAYDDGYFWQCFFLSVITSSSRRHGALVYMTRRLPSFALVGAQQTANGDGNRASDESDALSGELSLQAEAVLHPEPGLLIRCFAAGLQDWQLLVQRGYLDLLVAMLPLNSPVLQDRVEKRDLERLVSAAVRVVLRRDMSLNKRLWLWFLGPDPVAETDEESKTQSLAHEHRLSQKTSEPQAAYFERYGASALQTCILDMLNRPTTNPTERAQPFRICLSLMDRWEVGGILVPSVLSPALQSAYQYSRTASDKESAEVIRSASLFFDGVESSLIWSMMIEMIESTLDKANSATASAESSLSFLKFIIEQFNVREEDMLQWHIPNAVLVLLHGISTGLGREVSIGTPLLSDMIGFGAALFNLVPSSAFRLRVNESDNEPTGIAPRDEHDAELVSSIKTAYKGREDDRLRADIDSRPYAMSDSIAEQASLLLLQTLRTSSLYSCLPEITSLSVSVVNKLEDVASWRSNRLGDTLEQVVQAQLIDLAGGKDHFILASSVITLLSNSASGASPGPFISIDHLLRLTPLLMNYLWTQLSPWTPDHHVEAVRLIWQLETLNGADDRVESQLSKFVTSHVEHKSDMQEECGRFATLWEHSMQSTTSKGDKLGSFGVRRVSGMTIQQDAAGKVDMAKVLKRPLLLLLDELEDAKSESITFLVNWLQGLQSLDVLVGLLVDDLQDIFTDTTATAVHSKQQRQERMRAHNTGRLLYSFTHLRNLLRHATPYTWQVFATLNLDSTEGERTALHTVAHICQNVLQWYPQQRTSSLLHCALDVLEMLLESPDAVVLRESSIEDALIRDLMTAMRHGIDSLQLVFLRCVLKAIKLRLEVSAEEPIAATNGVSSTGQPNHVKRSSLQMNAPTVAAVRHPPPELLSCLKAGLSSPSCRLYIDHWINFLSDLLPLYADAIFANMIPLVECFCSQISVCFNSLQSLAANHPRHHDRIPASTLPALLNGLELLLAHAHHQLRVQDMASSATKAPDQPQSFFGNMVSGVFSADGPPSKTHRGNSRLTVILCMQDAVKACFSIWAWATSGNANARPDPSSAATIQSNGLRLRNRTKRILEHLFMAETLECLETLVVRWLPNATDEVDKTRATPVFALLHVLNGTRPRMIMPIILNALYSRTNLEALDPGRRSSLTSDLSAPDLVAFLLAYTSTLEDDATDEIWGDCTTFLRDVLGNPMPHRQILPALLEFAVMLAEKIDNTNFGELSRMRRELGDIFQRLLTATFTARPVAGGFDSPVIGTTTGSTTTRHDFLSSLESVAQRLQVILESNERVMHAVNNISSNVISPTFHAKAFPGNVTSVHLRLLYNLAEQSPGAKTWKKDVSDAFYDPRTLTCSPDSMQANWCPVFRKWALSDKDRMPDLLSRFVAPSTAGIMFGVGASAARLEADRRAQMNLRRIALLMLSCEQDAFVSSLGFVEEKVGELCMASATSSPSSATRAEVYMLFRALVLCISPVHLSAFWPLLNDSLQAALSSAIPASRDQETYNNVAVMQACKLLDLLVTVGPDEFQVHEWLYATDTIDAVYRPSSWNPSALVDHVAESLRIETSDQPSLDNTPSASAPSAQGLKRPFLETLDVDGADLKAMARDEFVRTLVQPFFSQLSMYAYEATYEMGTPDMQTCRMGLLRDLLDEGTIA